MVKFATVGPGLRVVGDFSLHVPGSLLADGLFRISARSVWSSGLSIKLSPE